MLCGGTGAFGNQFDSRALDGQGVCCEETGSTCNATSPCCDGYCLLNVNPNDAGQCVQLNANPIICAP